MANVDHGLDDPEAEVNRTLYLSGLATPTTEDEIRELFLQAGPLENVAFLANKNAAFVTFKHSVSVPYAKKLFHDTKLHGRYISINYRHGSLHYAGQRTERSMQNAKSGKYGNSYGYNKHQETVSQNSQSYEPVAHGYTPQDPFIARPPVQGYRSSSDSREYAPSYIGFDNPPLAFMGAIPINQPGHRIDLDSRRQRLLHQQHYVSEANSFRNSRRSNHRN